MLGKTLCFAGCRLKLHCVLAQPFQQCLHKAASCRILERQSELRCRAVQVHAVHLCRPSRNAPRMAGQLLLVWTSRTQG